MLKPSAYSLKLQAKSQNSEWILYIYLYFGLIFFCSLQTMLQCTCMPFILSIAGAECSSSFSLQVHSRQLEWSWRSPEHDNPCQHNSYRGHSSCDWLYVVTHREEFFWSYLKLNWRSYVLWSLYFKNAHLARKIWSSIEGALKMEEYLYSKYKNGQSSIGSSC